MADDDYLWNPSATPDPAIERLEALLQPASHTPVPLRTRGQPRRAHWTTIRQWHVIAAGVLLSAGALYGIRRLTVTPWAVDAVHGAPLVRAASGAVTGGALVRGGAVETDARSTAVLTVGHIGRATIGPGSRVRLVGDDPSRQLLSLERGSLRADIDAPPRYFLVQTASALAVDLGCIYTLTADEQGNGLLTVEEGEVELQLGTVQVSVLAGNSAALLSGRGPGLPFPVRATDSLRRAVAAWDADPASDGALALVLRAADVRSTITLWHLLRRVSPDRRAGVYERLASITPPPTTVTRERVLRGESGALQRWRTALQPGWITEPPAWRRVWLTLSR